jgi:hypothetical protein
VESHHQDANVAEVSYGEPMTGKPEHPVKRRNRPAVSDSGSRPSNAPDKSVTNRAVEAAQGSTRKRGTSPDPKP